MVMKNSFKSQSLSQMPILCFETTVVSAWGLPAAKELPGVTYSKKRQAALRGGGLQTQMTEATNSSLQLNKQM